MLRRLVRPCLVFLLFQTACAPHALCQNAQRFSAVYDAPCPSNFRAEMTENDGARRFRELRRLPSNQLCESLAPARHEPQSSEPFRAHASHASADPVLDELLAMGTEGLAIAIARQEVIEILRESSACSAWYAGAEPNPAVKFASLRFLVDSAGQAMVLPNHDAATGFYYLEPYVARAQQDVGAGSTITLNSSGAFFVSRALSVLSSHAPPASRLPNTWVPLHVGDYDGGSLKARVTTLLHEYGHIVGLLPVDSGQRDSARLSTQNTETVVAQCRRQIEASRNRSILLAPAFVRLERSPTAR